MENHWNVQQIEHRSTPVPNYPGTRVSKWEVLIFVAEYEITGRANEKYYYYPGNTGSKRFLGPL
eukprot:3218140-Rhodomonas_salina.1